MDKCCKSECCEMKYEICSGGVKYHEDGVIYMISKNNDIVINQEGCQTTIPAKFCFNCGRPL